MEPKNSITILSTFAKDTLFDEMRGFVRAQEGGPAFYLTKAFTAEGIPFRMQSPEIVEVEILLKKDGEFGRIPRRPTLLTQEFADIKSKILVISTLLDEFNLAGLSNFKGRVFIDIQGYVRDGENFGKKKYWEPSEEVVNSIFCLKGTAEELTNIPRAFLERQKQKLLIETRGESGCEVFTKGECFAVRPRELVKVAHTIGAGDSFFAYFVSRFIRTKNVFASAEYATEKTLQFLKSR